MRLYQIPFKDMGEPITYREEQALLLYSSSGLSSFPVLPPRWPEQSLPVFSRREPSIKAKRGVGALFISMDPSVFHLEQIDSPP
jgi:hypothetical protein